ncbi:hypothetical protein [Spiroplasma alleghenense]|uniref:Lipoprotein n=1 Tax=Spiroplasma alleghenense TaxID=216931 RepID=A0A345Z3N1_9MOLU|nr:hypothetical protein [Spiroplasma alleghenense]AXK51210.1 hypothetical protein SALLE_v1c05360 [Spiroplasma alleghenense]
MKRILQILCAILPIASSAAVTASCSVVKKDNLNGFIFKDKFFSTKNAAQEYARSLTKPYTEDDTEFSSYKGVIYKNYQSEKMYEEILKDHPIVKKQTLQNLDNLDIDDSNKINSRVYDSNKSKIVQVYRDSHGNAVRNEQEAIESYLSTIKYWQSDDESAKDGVFEFKHELTKFLNDKKRKELESSIQTDCYTIGFTSCFKKSDVLSKIKKETVKNFSFGDYHWSNNVVPPFEKFDNKLIQKYIDKYIRKSHNSLNGYVINFNSNNQNFYGDKIIWSELGKQSFSDKLSNWEVVDSQSISLAFGSILAQSKFLNILTEFKKNPNIKDKSWSVLRDIFDNNSSDYSDFINAFNLVSDSEWDSDDNILNFNRKKEEKDLNNFDGLNNKQKSLLFLKKIMLNIESSNNDFNEVNMNLFNKRFKDAIKKSLIVNVTEEIKNPISEIFDNKDFLNIDILDLLLSPSLFNSKLTNKKKFNDMVKTLNIVINKFVENVEKLPIVSELPFFKEISKVWKLSQSLSPIESKILKINFGNGQEIYFKGMDLKLPIFNYSFNLNNPAKYVYSKQFFKALVSNKNEEFYTFMNTLHSSKELAINALKNYIIRFPEKFSEVKLEINYYQENSKKRVIKDKSLENFETQLNEYANDIFNSRYKDYAKKEYTNGFGQTFGSRDEALTSLNKTLENENYQYLLKPTFKMLYDTYYKNNQEFIEENLDYIKNVLVLKKSVLSNDLLISSNFDQLKASPYLTSNYFQIYLNDRLLNFKTYEDAKYYLVRNLDIQKGIYNIYKRFVIYQGNIFKNLENFNEYIEGEIIETNSGGPNEKLFN